MLRELTYVKTRPLIPGVEDDGHYNHSPKPIVEMTWHDFWRIFGVYSPTHTEYRQVRDLPGIEYAAAQIFWFDNCGWLITAPNKWTLDGMKIRYLEEPRYFRIGCEHDYQNVKSQGTFHTQKCSKCGHEQSYDSSG